VLFFLAGLVWDGFDGLDLFFGVLALCVLLCLVLMSYFLVTWISLSYFLGSLIS